MIQIMDEMISLGQTLDFFQNLDKKEVKQFIKFLNSPFFGAQPAQINLVIFLKDFPDETKTEFSISELYDILFPEESGNSGTKLAFRRKKLFNTFSDLNLNFQKFIAVTALEHDPLQQQYYLVRRYARSDNPRLYRKALNAFDSLIPRERDGFKRHMARFQYFDFLFYAPLNDPFHKKHTEGLLKEMAHELETSFLYLRMDLFCNWLYRGKIVQGNLAQEEIDNLVRQAGQYPKAAFPDLHIYRQLLELGNQMNRKDMVEAIFEDLRLYCRQIDRILARNFLVHLMNYCTLNYFRYSSDFLEFKIRLGEWGAGEGILFFQIGDDAAGFRDKAEREWEVGIQDDLFLDLAITLIGAKDRYAEALGFIRENFSKLPAEKQHVARNMALTYYYFHTDRFWDAAGCLDQVRSNEYKYAFRYHSMKVRIEYELFLHDPGRLNVAASAVEAFKKYILRNSLEWEESRRVLYRNLGWYLERMIDFQLSDPRKKLLIRKKLSDSLAVKRPAAADWVRKKIEELA